MAKKRSLIDATLNAFGLSGRFTQDVEDLKANGAIQDDRPAAPAAASTSTEAPSPNAEKRRFFAALGKLGLDVKVHGAAIRDVASKVLGRKVHKLGTLAVADLQRLADWTLGIVDGREAPPEWKNLIGRTEKAPPAADDQDELKAEAPDDDGIAPEDREVWEWFKGLAGDRFQEFEKLANEAGYETIDAAFEAQDEGIQTQEELFEWVHRQSQEEIALSPDHLEEMGNGPGENDTTTSKPFEAQLVTDQEDES